MLFKNIFDGSIESPYKRVLKQLPNFLISSFGIKALNFITIPILTNLLTPSDYGILNIFGTYATIISVIFTLNLQSSIVRYLNQNIKEFGSFLFQIIVIQSFLISFFSLIIIKNTDYFSELLNLPSEIVPYLGPVAFLYVLNSWIQYYLKGIGNSSSYRRYSLIKGFCSAISAIIFIYVLNHNRYMGKIYSELIIVVFLIIYAAFMFLPLVKIIFNYGQIKYMMKYSLGLIPAFLGSIFLAQIDRIMISNSIGNYETGLYSFAYVFASIHSLFSNAIYNSLIPEYFKLMNEKDLKSHDELIIQISKLISFFGCVLILTGDILGAILGSKEFEKGLNLIPVIVLGIYFLHLTHPYTMQIRYTYKTYVSSIIIILSGILNIIINYFFIPEFGISGSAYATLISYVFQFLLTYYVVQYVLKLHATSIKDLLKLSLPVILCCSIIYVINFEINILSITIRSLIIILCALYIFGVSSFKSILVR